MFSRIVFATDGSDDAHSAEDYALELARKNHSKVFVVHAYSRVPEVLGAPAWEHIIAERVGTGRQVLSGAVRLFERAGVTVEGELIEGDLAEAVLSVADARDCDLIIMGEHIRSELEDILFGCSSHQVIHHANCPVLVIP